MEKKVIAFVNAQVFDGENLIGTPNVIVVDGKIDTVGGDIPDGAEIIDATGCTLMPGLIDAHNHPNMNTLGMDMRFGVTMVCQMQGYFSTEQIEVMNTNKQIANSQKCFFAVTAPGGHPHELLSPETLRMLREKAAKMGVSGKRMKKEASTPQEAEEIVENRIAQGADYIKLMIEDGTVFGHPGIPDLTDEVIKATCDAAHKHGTMAVAHTMSISATQRAIDNGVDGLMHLFVDRPYTEEIVRNIAKSGAFVCPTIVAGASTVNDSDAVEFGKDSRVSGKLDGDWQKAFGNFINTYPQGSMQNLLDSVKALHDAGVDILVGTDASQISVGGMVHGASMHHEMQLLVRAGLSPLETLRAATSVTARRFNITGKGYIRKGMDADLLLVRGNPAEEISSTLNIEGVWREGERFINALNR